MFTHLVTSRKTSEQSVSKFRSGFTLIELLVVIAIIAILAAILFPVFGRARENARRSSCQSNLKQIGLGIAQYSQDYDEKLPSTFFGTTFPGYYQWQDAVMPYVKSTQLFNCPSDPDPNHKFVGRSTSSTTVAPDGVTGYGSYGANNAYWWAAENWGDSTNWPGPMAKPGGMPSSIANVPAIATTILATDCTGSFQIAWAGDWEDPETIDNSGPAPSIHAAPVAYNSDQGAAVARHLNTTNALFCDGHVKAMNLNALMEKSSGGVLRYWTRAND